MGVGRVALGFYGWRIVWALAFSTTVAYGVLYYSFAVFVTSMEQELSWSRAQTSGAFTVCLLVAGLVAPFLGRILDKHGARQIMGVGSLGAAALLWAWAGVQDLLGLYLVFALLGVCAAATFYDAAFTTIAVWFREKRGQAMLAITLVAGLASTVFVPLDTWLLHSLGWRDAVRALSLPMLLCAPMLYATVRRHPSDVGQTVDGLPEDTKGSSEHHAATTTGFSPALPASLWFSRAFVCLALAFALGRVAASVLGAHLVPLLREAGNSAAFAALVAGAVGVMQLAGRLVLTAFQARRGMVLLASVAFVLHGLGVAALLLPGALGIWVFVALYGATNGAITLTRAGLTGEIFPVALYGRVNGMVSLVVALSGAITPFLAGVVRSNTGSYQWVLWGVALALLLAAAVVLGTKPPNPSK